MNPQLEAIIQRMAQIRKTKQELEEEQKTLNHQLLNLTGGQKTTIQGTYGSIVVTTRTSFKPSIAEQLLNKKRLSAKEKERYYDKVINRKMVEANFSDIAEQANVESEPYVIFRPSKDM